MNDNMNKQLTDILEIVGFIKDAAATKQDIAGIRAEMAMGFNSIRAEMAVEFATV